MKRLKMFACIFNRLQFRITSEYRRFMDGFFNYCNFNSRALIMVSGLGYFITWHQPLTIFRSNSISWKQKQKFPVSSFTLRREVHKLKASLSPAGFLPMYRMKRLATCLKLPRHIRGTQTVGRREAFLKIALIICTG